ncbi:prophage MuMc02, transposition protein B [Methylococcus capsulatus str. Bath]|uniref:Prophage MuMc02, transposition protein B n=2 Tax=Methylococcaceae TaxID=403 RepID=Q602V5_METCA|nr:prophage MuMc02, transposition protein B [Methylococcus capsulatus str. Bath]
MALAMGRSMHQSGLVVLHGPSGYGKSMAAAWVKARSRAYYLQLDDFTRSRKVLLKRLGKALGMQLAKSATVDEMADAVMAQLEQSGRPLIIDEADYLETFKLVDSIRSIYEGSKAAILLIGEEALPFKLKEWERFDGRILDRFPAQPVSLPDARELAGLYCPGKVMGEDLLERLVEVAKGSVRRVSTNLERMYEEALANGWDRIDLATWGNRPIHTGEAPRRG